MTNSGEYFGLVLQGYSDRQSLYFFLIAGFSSNEQSNHSLDFISAAGAPGPDYFSSLNTLSDPGVINEKILEVRQTMIEQGKHFYVEEVEEQFKNFFKTELSDILEFLEQNDLSGLEQFIEREFYRYELSNVNASSASYESLRFGSKDDTDDETESEASGSEDSSSEATTIEVVPEIDVQHGRRVENLQPGTPVIVRLTKRSAELFGSGDTQETIRVSGEFLKFEREQNEAEGRIHVQIQDGLRGAGDVSRGSLIRRDRSSDDFTPDPYERQLQPLIWIIVILMVLLMIFAYLVIF